MKKYPTLLKKGSTVCISVYLSLRPQHIAYRYEIKRILRVDCNKKKDNLYYHIFEGGSTPTLVYDISWCQQIGHD